MKIETAELQFIRDDNDRCWFPGNSNHVEWYKEGTLEQLYAYMIDKGYIITLDPLEEALEAVEKYGWNTGTLSKTDVRKLLRKLAADMEERA